MAGIREAMAGWFARLSGLPREAMRSASGGSWINVSAPIGGLPPLTEQTAVAITAVNACVKLLAGAVAALPMNIYRMNYATGVKAEVWDNDLWWILNEEFHTRWPAAAGWEAMMRSRLLHGDAFAIIGRNNAGRVISIRPVRNARVGVYQLIDSDRLVYEVLPDVTDGRALSEYYDQDDMLHVPGDGFNGLISPSVLQYELGATGPAALATQEQAARFYANGMQSTIAISSAAQFPPEQLAQLRQDIEAIYGGVRNFYRPLLLTGGLTASAINVSPADAQLLESRKFGVEEVARIYGVPPFMIGHSEKTTSWGSGVEAMGAGFVRYTLRRHLHAITNEFNRKLFPSGAEFCEFDTSELERPSFKEFMEGQRVGLGRAGERPIFSQNEVRRRFNLPPVPGGDDMQPIGQAPTERAEPDA